MNRADSLHDLEKTSGNNSILENYIDENKFYRKEQHFRLFSFLYGYICKLLLLYAFARVLWGYMPTDFITLMKANSYDKVFQLVFRGTTTIFILFLIIDWVMKKYCKRISSLNRYFISRYKQMFFEYAYTIVVIKIYFTLARISFVDKTTLYLFLVVLGIWMMCFLLIRSFLDLPK